MEFTINNDIIKSTKLSFFFFEFNITAISFPITCLLQNDVTAWLSDPMKHYFFGTMITKQNTTEGGREKHMICLTLQYKSTLNKIVIHNHHL